MITEDTLIIPESLVRRCFVNHISGMILVWQPEILGGVPYRYVEQVPMHSDEDIDGVEGLVYWRLRKVLYHLVRDYVNETGINNIILSKITLEIVSLTEEEAIDDILFLSYKLTQMFAFHYILTYSIEGYEVVYK